MLIPREELTFDFKGATFDTSKQTERKLLAWVFDQFLYGEVTGIQCGWWLYKAPHLDAAVFLARQAGEEFSHVRRFLKIISLLGEKPGKAHPAVRFLSTGMMGHSWGEHVAIEMALGEGLVLGVFYAMIDTIPDPEIRRILSTSVVEEERHVVFGEKETMAWLQKHPSSRSLLLGQALIQALGLRFVKRFIMKKLVREVGADHPVMSRFDAFYEHALSNFETCIQRLGLSQVPPSRLSFVTKFSLIVLLPFRGLWARFRYKTPLLTKSYLEDPALCENQNSRPSSS
ncbi:MAG TPA: ferritin-like domain-containing protein [bacterium]|nr:ferritin-like domain-containing protein [bacterium]